jgi:hypothetical protein
MADGEECGRLGSSGTLNTGERGYIVQSYGQNSPVSSRAFDA